VDHAAADPWPYELICDLPGHYAAGMHDELHVTTS